MGIKWQFTLPLGPEAILEAQLLMLASHNILNPANGAPITVPSQDMVWVYII
jgi:DNA-directed RNA polymerase subunit beta'